MELNSWIFLYPVDTNIHPVDSKKALKKQKKHTRPCWKPKVF